MTATATRFGNASAWVFEATWVVLALAVHAALLGGVPGPSKGAGVAAPSDPVDVSFIEEDPVEPEPEPEPEPEDTEEPEPVKPLPKPKTFKAPKEPPKAPEKPPAAARETPVAFDNVVLTNESESDSSWSTEQASGKSVEGPIGSPDAAVTGESKSGIVGGVVGGTGEGAVVDVGDLSKAPIPPSLKRKLERLYPKKARAEGVEGEAVVRLQISPDGVPSKIRVISETPPGYELGAACVQTLRGEKWGAPVSKDGARVRTRVTYRCGFEIRY
ncbi:MAG: TonB family protein [Polyangiales bacterium]